jgi:hypothetical protein
MTDRFAESARYVGRFNDDFISSVGETRLAEKSAVEGIPRNGLRFAVKRKRYRNLRGVAASATVPASATGFVVKSAFSRGSRY